MDGRQKRRVVATACVGALAAAAAGLVGLAYGPGEPASLAAPDTEPPPGFSDAPAALAAACERTAQDSIPSLKVLCPARVPTASGALVVRHGDLEGGRCAFLVDVGSRRPPRRGPFHILFGGVCRQLPLATRAGRWPARRVGENLRLVAHGTSVPGQDAGRVVRPELVRRTQVRGQRALLLRAEPYPDGGLHGGHYALVWNEGGSGYAASLHFARGDRGRAPAEQEAAELEGFVDSMYLVD